MSKMPDRPDNIEDKMAVIRHILLHGDRARIEQLENIVNDTDLLSEHVDPIIDNKIANIKDDFSNTFGKEVGSEFEKKLLSSEDLLLTVLSPMMGKMIKKFVSIEIKKLQDKIDQQFKPSFSFKRYYHIIRAKVFGIESSALFLADLDDFKTRLQDVFAIQISGLVIASARSKDSKSGDGDIFSSMLTAIKFFGEDSFKRKEGQKQELELIEYENQKIFLQNHHNYYFAAVLNGSLNNSEKDKLANQLMEFAGKEKKLNLPDISPEDCNYLSEQLKKTFFELDKVAV